jgi:GntR family transcriptional repressor for pyruvate dehydrogenase complex
MGLLQFAPNRGYRVVPRLKPETRAELFEAREMLERAAAPLATAKRTEAQLAKLRSLNTEMRALGRKKRPDQESFFLLNHQFHRLYVQMTGNSFLERMFESLSFDLLLSRETTEVVDIARLSEEHDQIIAAIEKRDAPLLDVTLMKHIRSTR